MGGIGWEVFDLIIFGFLVGTGVLVAELTARARFRGWHWWRISVVVLLLMSWLTVFYGSFIEPHILRTHEQYIDIAKGNADRDVRVIVFADPHAGPYKHEAWAQKVVDQINAIDAEVVLIIGDYVFNATEQVEMLAPYSQINKPVYAVLGNHDQEFADANQVAAAMGSYGIHMLRNASEPFVFESGAVVNFVGIDDVWFTPDPIKALGEAQPDQPTIMLAHNPDYILDPTSDQADLVISGHTHCGQIRLPWLGPVPPLPTVLGRGWDCGLYSYDGGQLWITPGVGETGPRARLFNPPTIDILTLHL